MTDVTELPIEQKLARSKKQMMWFAIASLVMMFAGLTSAYVVILLLGLWFLYYSVKLFRERTNAVARKLMLVSVSYITLIQIIYVIELKPMNCIMTKIVPNTKVITVKIIAAPLSPFLIKLFASHNVKLLNKITPVL